MRCSLVLLRMMDNASVASVTSPRLNVCALNFSQQTAEPAEHLLLFPLLPVKTKSDEECHV